MNAVSEADGGDEQVLLTSLTHFQDLIAGPLAILPSIFLVTALDSFSYKQLVYLLTLKSSMHEDFSG